MSVKLDCRDTMEERIWAAIVSLNTFVVTPIFYLDTNLARFKPNDIVIVVVLRLWYIKSSCHPFSYFWQLLLCLSTNCASMRLTPGNLSCWFSRQVSDVDWWLGQQWWWKQQEKGCDQEATKENIFWDTKINAKEFCKRGKGKRNDKSMLAGKLRIKMKSEWNR